MTKAKTKPIIKRFSPLFATTFALSIFIIDCPYGTKGVWIVKSIDMTKLRSEKGFPIDHDELREYIKNLPLGE